jgi:hydroxymethylpyrimidine/phosphomethylpyrimidine kinase
MALCISDVGVDAVKTGMLCNVHIVRAEARILGLYLVPHLVVDPVRKSTSGNRLLLADAEEVFIKRILPLAEVVTPNLREAGWLSGVDVADIEGMRRAAERILKLGPRAVLVKGGHLHGTPTDLLYDGNTFLELPGERLETKHTHGAGCSFSAALATELGAGVPLPDAARRAKRFVTEAIRHSIGVGHDRGPTNPLAGAGLRASRS